jgi:hypothetical protein
MNIGQPKISEGEAQRSELFAAATKSEAGLSL